jgi:hypothetical protein
MGFRIFSGAVLAIIVYFAAQKAGMQGGGAFAVAMVPLISAAINVLTTPIFSASALAGIFYLILPLMPVGAWLGEDVAAALRGVTRELKSSVAQPATPATSASSQLTRRLAEIEAACASGALAPSACEDAKRQAIQQFSQSLGLGDNPAPRPAN